MAGVSRTISFASVLLAALISATSASAQGGCCEQHRMSDGSGNAPDMQVLHQLFEHRQEVTRHISLRPDGVETLTESTNPEVTQLLQTHVASMLARVKDSRAIHRRDPLFAELFRHAEQIDATLERTAGGVRVTETSSDPYVVTLIQAHAEVVSAFIANGPSEMMKNHPLPARPEP